MGAGGGIPYRQLRQSDKQLEKSQQVSPPSLRVVYVGGKRGAWVWLWVCVLCGGLPCTCRCELQHGVTIKGCGGWGRKGREVAFPIGSYSKVTNSW